MSELKLPQLKAALTRAKKTRNPEKVLSEVERAFTVFNETYWPDCWMEWEIARVDAIYQRNFNR